MIGKYNNEQGVYMVDLLKDAKYIKGVGPNRIKQLNKLGIYTLEDVITYYPRGYENRGIKKKIAELVNGEEALIEAKCVSKMAEIKIRKNMSIYKLIVRDETATCTLTWFNSFYLKNKFKIGETYKFFGKVKRSINPNLKIGGILLTLVDKRTKLSKETKQLLEENYGNIVKIYHTKIDKFCKSCYSYLEIL